MLFLLLILSLLYIFIKNICKGEDKEFFTEYNLSKDNFKKYRLSKDNLKDISNFDRYNINSIPKKDAQRYLGFLSNVNDSYKKIVPKTGPFKGTCNDELNKMYERQALRNVYDTMDSSPFSNLTKNKCVSISNYVCEFTDPYLYLSESRMPPRWIIKSLKDVHLPKHTNLKCFKTNINCCKDSYRKIHKPLHFD